MAIPRMRAESWSRGSWLAGWHQKPCRREVLALGRKETGGERRHLGQHPRHRGSGLQEARPWHTRDHGFAQHSLPWAHSGRQAPSCEQGWEVALACTLGLCLLPRPGPSAL